MVIFTGMMAVSRPPSKANQRSVLRVSSGIKNTSRSLRPFRRYNRKLLVVKFGGSSLASSRKIALASQVVAKEYAKGTRIVVVVSAVGRTTDRLLELTDGASGIVGTDRDDILAMGERTSARIFSASLKSHGIQSRYFDPADRDWPIITDDRFSNANPVASISIQRIRRYVGPLLVDGIVPVIAGFIGKTRDGRISTLGRGGSDTTTLLFAKSLGADEVVLVTNAPGIMTGDPRLIQKARLLRKIDMTTLVGMADSGRKFIHRRALRFKDSRVNIRVISNTAGDLRSPGTIITGEPLPELEVKVHNPDAVASITLVGRNLPSNPPLMRKVATIVRKSLLAVSQDQDSAIVYVSETPSLSRQIAKLHEALVDSPSGVAVATRRGLALITVKGVGLEETPRVTARVSETLRANSINIFGILTITSSVLIFVDSKVRKMAARLIQKSLGENMS